MVDRRAACIADSCADVFEALGDETRAALLALVERDGEREVGGGAGRAV